MGFHQNLVDVRPEFHNDSTFLRNSMVRGKICATRWFDARFRHFSPEPVILRFGFPNTLLTSGENVAVDRKVFRLHALLAPVALHRPSSFHRQSRGQRAVREQL